MYAYPPAPLRKRKGEEQLQLYHIPVNQLLGRSHSSRARTRESARARTRCSLAARWQNHSLREQIATGKPGLALRAIGAFGAQDSVQTKKNPRRGSPRGKTEHSGFFKTAPPLFVGVLQPV